jgi:hypothetical protein
MISQANGFEFVGAFEEKDAPRYYAFPDEFHIDDYLNNDRILVMCESTLDNPPKRIKWYVLNYKNGSLTKSFSSNDNFGPDWGNFMQFAFDHRNFKIQSWHTTLVWQTRWLLHRLVTPMLYRDWLKLKLSQVFRKQHC